MKNCPHVNRFRHWHGYALESSYHETCMTCGEILPLGPARLDGPHANDIAIEIRAAEHAWNVEIGRPLEMTDAEIDAWVDHRLDAEWRAYGPVKQAAWLARQIYWHDPNYEDTP